MRRASRRAVERGVGCRSWGLPSGTGWMSGARHPRRPASADPETGKAAISTSPTHAPTIASSGRARKELSEQPVHGAVVVGAVVLERELAQRALALEAEPL